MKLLRNYPQWCRFACFKVRLSDQLFRIAAAVVLTLSVAPLFAQAGFGPIPGYQPGTTVNGVVTAGERAVAGVHIMLESVESGVTASTVTMDDGSFQFANLPAGEYMLVATTGAGQVETNVSVSSFTPTLHIEVAANKQAARTSPTVSVGQLKLPKEAQKALHEAERASQHDDAARAMQKVNEAIGIAPGSAEALTTRATLHLASGNTQAALADAEAAVRSDPAYPLAYFVLASVLNRNARFTDAERAAGEGLRRAPNAWQGHFELAQALAGQSRDPAALKEYDLAAHSAPAKFPGVHLLRAVTLLKLKQVAQAVKDLKEAIRREPNGPAAALAARLSSQADAALRP